MNDFEKMCKELESRKRCNNQICTDNNEYICAKRAVYRYANGERNRVLKIKAEARSGDWWVYVMTLLSIFAVFVSILALLYAVVCESEGYSVDVRYRKIIILAVLFVYIYLCFMINKFHSVSRWQEYILVAIEELEKETNQTLDTRNLDGIANTEYLPEIEDRKKALFYRKLKGSLIRMGIYLLYSISMVPFANFVMKVETNISPELIVILALVDVLAIAFILFNLWEDNSNDELLYAKPDVIPELHNIAIKDYEKELRKMEIEKLIQKYAHEYEQKRKKVDISNRTLVGGFLTIVLPILFTKVIESNSTITLGIAFLYVIPLLLELAIGTITSFQNESIRNTKCLERQLQDKYICKILEEVWGVKLENL